MEEQKYPAYYELEIQLPSWEGPEHLGLNFIKKVGTVHKVDRSYGIIYTLGSANFETPEKAYQWRLDVQKEIRERYPEDFYSDEFPCALCGLRFILGDKRLYGELELDENGNEEYYIHDHINGLKLSLDQFEIGDKSSLDNG